MAMRTGTVVMSWSAMMLGLALAGVMLTTSSSQARPWSSAAAARMDGDGAVQPALDPDEPVEADSRAAAVAAAGRAADGAAEGDRAHARDAGIDADAGRQIDARMGDRFDAVVRSLQARDGVENTSPPFMWLASLAVSAAQPAGVLSLRLATFEGSRLRDVANDREFSALVDRAENDGWTPMVRVRSKRSSEMVNILARTRGDQVSLLIVTVDQGDAVVAQVALKPDTVAKWLKEPGNIQAHLR